jgi:hypothetical protein
MPACAGPRNNSRSSAQDSTRANRQMAKRQTKPKDKLGRSYRYPSDYGLRDHEQEDRAEENGSWVPGDKGQGREGHSKGYGGSGGKGRSIRPGAQIGRDGSGARGVAAATKSVAPPPEN